MQHQTDGTVVIQDLSPLSSCHRLAAQDLTFHPGIQDLTPLSSLVGLKALRLRHCSLIRSLDPLRGLTQMTFLHISYTSVSSLEPLSSLVQLEDLDLSYLRTLTCPSQAGGPESRQMLLPDLPVAPGLPLPAAEH